MSLVLPVEHRVNLRRMNSFGLPAVARRLVRITSDADVRRLLDDPALGRLPRLVIGGGSNLVLSRDPPGVVVRVEVPGRRLVETRAGAWVVEARHLGEITLAILHLDAVPGARLVLTRAGAERRGLLPGARFGVRLDPARVHVMPTRGH